MKEKLQDQEKRGNFSKSYLNSAKEEEAHRYKAKNYPSILEG